MNKFVPLDYNDFKRFAAYLKRGLGVRHWEALTFLSQASGFKDFLAITAIFRPDQSSLKPCALQYAGDMGFEIWREQLVAIIGAERIAAVEPNLRCRYQGLFEVGGKLANWHGHRFNPGASTTHLDAPLAEASLDEVGDALEVRSVPSNVPAVVVTYRRRRRLIEQAPATTEA